MTEEEYDNESFRRSNVFPLFPLLRSGIFHTTSIDGYKGIRDSGFIIANQGQFPYRYPQSEVYYGRSMGYVCLFDFETATEEQCIRIHHNWTQFFADHEPATIVLKLNRSALGTDLIPNSARPQLGSKEYRPAIPYVEAWYPRPIPFAAVEGFVITLSEGPYGDMEFEEFTLERTAEFEHTLTLIEQAWLDVLESADID